MSKIGKINIPIPEKVKYSGNNINIKVHSEKIIKHWLDIFI